MWQTVLNRCTILYHLFVKLDPETGVGEYGGLLQASSNVKTMFGNTKTLSTLFILIFS